MPITCQREAITAAEFGDVLERSGLAARRPTDPARLQRMLDGADLVVTARSDQGLLVGVARSITDRSYACYLSDLAVDAAFQGQGIGRRLIDLTRQEAGEESMCLLLSAPAAEAFYHRLGMPVAERAFIFPRER